MNEELNLSDFGEDCVKLWEEDTLEPKLVAYNDGTGTQTIAWGCTEGVYKGMKITADQAEAMFQKEIAKHTAIVRKYLKRTVLQYEFDALTSFTFNEGYRPTVFAAANGKNYQDAVPQIMLLYNKARNEKTGKLETWDGLVERRTKEIQLWHGAYRDARIHVAPPYEVANKGEIYYAADPKQKPSRVTVGAATGTVSTVATTGAMSLLSAPAGVPDKIAAAQPKIDAALGHAEQGLAMGHRIQDVGGQINEFGGFLMSNPAWLLLMVIAIAAIALWPKKETA